jgi:phosphoribosylpyrophosphate synthetase
MRGRTRRVGRHLPYARTFEALELKLINKLDKSRAPISAKLIANMLVTAGCNHVVC